MTQPKNQTSAEGEKNCSPFPSTQMGFQLTTRQTSNLFRVLCTFYSGVEKSVRSFTRKRKYFVHISDHKIEFSTRHKIWRCATSDKIFAMESQDRILTSITKNVTVWQQIKKTYNTIRNAGKEWRWNWKIRINLHVQLLPLHWLSDLCD